MKRSFVFGLGCIVGYAAVKTAASLAVEYYVLEVPQKLKKFAVSLEEASLAAQMTSSELNELISALDSIMKGLRNEPA